MCFMRMVRHISAVLSFPGRVLMMCVLVDILYMMCLHEAALLPAVPENNSLGDSGNLSSEQYFSHSSPEAVPPPAALSSSSASSSSSFYDSDTNSSYRSENGTDSFPSDSPDKFSSYRQSSDDSKTNNSNKHNNSSDKYNNNNTNGANRNSNSGTKHDNSGSQNQAVSSYRTRKEFPFALVVASSTAAVSILLFFCLSYIWHTKQLDRRAQKLAIRLAAESEGDVNCSQCRTPTTYMAGSSQDSGTDSGGEEVSTLPPPPPLPPVLDELNILNEEDEEEAEGEDGSRRKPGGVGRTLGSRRGSRGRGRRSGSRSSRKWSGHSGGQNRSSLVTDKEILNHFASRRHSTFFI